MRSLTKNPLLRAIVAAVSLGAVLFAANAAASTITIYKNDLDTTDSRAEIHQMAPRANCERGGSPNAFRFQLGKKARECFYKVPMAGKNLQVTAIARIFKSTPPKVLRRAYAGVSLRQNNDGSRYQLVVWPSTRRYGLRKVQPNGQIINFGSRKAGRKVKGPGKANRLTLRAFTGQKGNKVRLTEKETAILRYLYRAGQKPVSRETLLQEVWGYNSGVTTHTLETHVYRLRQKVEKDAANPSILVTDAGGYKLVP